MSVAASKTGTLRKIKQDCQRCKDTGRPVDVLVFVSPCSVRTATEEEWRSEIRDEFGWKLELRNLAWLAQAASRPTHASLVDDYLQIPPPGGDYVEAIEAHFTAQTDRALKRISVRIPGLPEPLPRDEIMRVEDQLSLGRGVLLSTSGSGTLCHAMTS